MISKGQTKEQSAMLREPLEKGGQMKRVRYHWFSRWRALSMSRAVTIG